jgi:3-phenylpropionate/cinnamic acid dioxygenase small subunit
LDIPIKSETETPLEAITEDTDIQAVYTEVEAAVKEQYDETKTNELIKKLEAIQTEDADKLAKRGELKKKLEGLKTVAKEGYTVLVDRIAKILSSADATTYPDATKRLEAVKAEIEKVKADLTNKELSFDTYEYYKGEVEKVTTLLNDTTKTDDEKLEALKQIFTIIESQNTTNTEVITDEDAIEQIYTGAKTALTSVFDK